MGTKRGFARLLTVSTVAIAALLCCATPSSAKMELIGYINGQAVILIWHNECSALDPPNNNVARIEITYVGPPQPGVFGDVTLIPPFDSFETDGETYLTLTASVPALLTSPPGHSFAGSFATPVDLGSPGDETLFEWAEFNTNEGACSGVAVHSTFEGAVAIPSSTDWTLIVVAMLLLGTGALYVNHRKKLQMQQA